jgi:hypothetical protein
MKVPDSDQQHSVPRTAIGANTAADPEAVPSEARDEFLSDEDLDLRNLSWAELVAWWDEWLRMAQTTNDRDRRTYSHGVFEREPE